MPIAWIVALADTIAICVVALREEGRCQARAAGVPEQHADDVIDEMVSALSSRLHRTAEKVGPHAAAMIRSTFERP